MSSAIQTLGDYRILPGYALSFCLPDKALAGPEVLCFVFVVYDSLLVEVYLSAA